MKQALKPNYMKLLTGAAGILGLSLRAVLYAVGTDQKGLLIEGHWASSGVWLLTAAIALILFLWCRQLTGSRNYQKAFPSSLFCAAGAALAGIGFVLSPTAQAPSPTFANIELVLRFVSAASLIWISYCRFRGEKPFFLLHCAVCLYLALRLVCQYRLWSSDPQIQNYAFYLGAHVALMITAYQFAAFDAGAGNHKKLWAAGLSAIYLSTVSLARSDEPFFLICCIVWIWTNLSHPFRKTGNAHSKNQTVQEDTP